MPEGNGLSVYHPRQPQQSTLWKLLDTHYDIFEREYEQTFRKSYGFRRAVVDDVVREYLKCGDLREGFARVRCPDCCPAKKVWEVDPLEGPNCGSEMKIISFIDVCWSVVSLSLSHCGRIASPKMVAAEGRFEACPLKLRKANSYH